jgi:hypothetical protein
MNYNERNYMMCVMSHVRSCNSRNRWVQVKNVKAVTENYNKIMFFIYIITIMIYVLNFLHVVTVVYNGGSCFCFENVQHLSSLSVWFFLWYHFSRILKFILCVPGHKMCICTDNVANQEVISFSQFERQNKKHCIHNCWKKNVNVKYCVCTIHTAVL